MPNQVRELAVKMIRKVKPITDKAKITGNILPLVTHSERAVRTSEKCDAIGIAYSILGIGSSRNEIVGDLRKAFGEGKISFAELSDAQWEINDFVDSVLEKTINNLESVCRRR